MNTFDRTKLRLGASALVFSALLTIVGLALRGPLITSIADPQAFAQSVASASNLIAETFLPLSLIVQLFAFMGLYQYLGAEDTSQRTAFWGMVLSVFGNGLFIPFAGMFAFAIPIVGQLYLAGQTDVIKVAELALGPGPGFAYLILSAFALMAGALSFAITMWRTAGVPRWLPVIYIGQAFGLSFGASLGYAFEVTGGVLLIIASMAFAKRMWVK